MVVDKFFLFGAIAGLFGSLVLGLYIWLIRTGVVMPDTRFHSMRWLHAFTQFYLFLTPFILGFLIQSAPRLFEVNKPLPSISKFTLPFTLFGAILFLIWPASLFGPAILASCCWGLAISLVDNFNSATSEVRHRFGIFALLGLFSLGSGAFLDLGQPANALLLFWFGIASIIFATAQQFIYGVLGGRRPSKKQAVITSLFFICSGIALVAESYGISNAHKAAAVLTTSTLALFIYSTGLVHVRNRLGEPLALAFLLAHIWAVTGAVLLWHEWQIDSVLHIWGIGYAVTLVIGVSLRIIGWLTDSKPLGDRAVLVILALWQVVCFTRGLQNFLVLPPAFIWAGTICAILTLTTWAGAIFTSVVGLVLRQLRVIKGATVNSQVIH